MHDIHKMLHFHSFSQIHTTYCSKHQEDGKSSTRIFDKSTCTESENRKRVVSGKAVTGLHQENNKLINQCRHSQQTGGKTDFILSTFNFSKKFRSPINADILNKLQANLTSLNSIFSGPSISLKKQQQKPSIS
jgi:hypothetical protein